MTVKFTVVAGELPPALAQIKVYAAVPAEFGVTVLLPLAASAPLQLPEAVHPVVLTSDQLIVVELPTVIDVSARVTVGAGGTTWGVSANAASACTSP